jgi:methyl-accepting chemotaxis protein
MGIIGAAVGTMTCDRLLDLVAAERSGKSGYAFLVDRAGLAIAHPDPSLVMKLVIPEDPRGDLAEIGRRMAKGATGSGAFVDRNTEKTLFFAPVAGAPWSVAVVRAKSELLAPLDVFRWAIVGSAAAAAVVSAALSILVVRRALAPLDSLGASFAALSRGDLTQRTGIAGGNEVAAIAKTYDEAMEGLAGVLRDVRRANDASADLGAELAASAEECSVATQEIEAAMTGMTERGSALAEEVGKSAAAAGEVRASANGLNALIERQSAALARSSTSVEEMLAGIESMQQGAEGKLSLSREAAEQARLGDAAMREATNAVSEIDGRAAAMLDTIKVIDDIAQRTNLLAMNAAIEAAHAGEYGRGFSVVADEIRKLSLSTGDNAKTVATALRDIVDRIAATADRNRATAAIFGGIRDGAIEVENGMEEILAGLKELSAGGGQIIEALMELRETSASVSEAGRGIAVRMDVIDETLGESNRVAAENSLALGEASSGLTQVSAAMGALTSISDRNGQAIAAFEEKIARFRV